jgi:hypothetical protein
VTLTPPPDLIDVKGHPSKKMALFRQLLSGGLRS